MNDKQLTHEQVALLAPFERNFRQATTAAYSSYPGQAGVQLMLDVWHQLTGYPYPYRRGCPGCLMNLVRDMGTLYFAAKAQEEAESGENSEKVKSASTAKKQSTKKAKTTKK